MKRFGLVLVFTFSAMLGCAQESDYFRVAGVKGMFCVPKDRQVHLPFGMFETDANKSSGFAFRGCGKKLPVEESCRIPKEISGGVVAPLEMRVRWQWQDFSDTSHYHEVMNNLYSSNIKKMTVFDDGKMLMVALKPPESTVFFWNRSGGRTFPKMNIVLRSSDNLVAVCAGTGADFLHNQKISGQSCNRYTSSKQYSLKYQFNIDSMSYEGVQKLDSKLVNAIDLWKCDR